MPKGEEMFFYHGYSGKCPKPPLEKTDDKSVNLRSAKFDNDRGELILSFENDKHFAINFSTNDTNISIFKKLVNLSTSVRFQTVEEI